MEAKRAVPKDEQQSTKSSTESETSKNRKIFVGGLPPSVDEKALRDYFETFGKVDDAVVMYDHENKRPRGFGFITFATEDSVDAVFEKGSLHTLQEKQVEVKSAVPRDQMQPQRKPQQLAQGGQQAARGAATGSVGRGGAGNFAPPQQQQQQFRQQGAGTPMFPTRSSPFGGRPGIHMQPNMRRQFANSMQNQLAAQQLMGGMLLGGAGPYAKLGAMQGYNPYMANNYAGLNMFGGAAPNLYGFNDFQMGMNGAVHPALQQAVDNKLAAAVGGNMQQGFKGQLDVLAENLAALQMSGQGQDAGAGAAGFGADGLGGLADPATLATMNGAAGFGSFADAGFPAAAATAGPGWST